VETEEMRIQGRPYNIAFSAKYGAHRRSLTDKKVDLFYYPGPLLLLEKSRKERALQSSSFIPGRACRGPADRLQKKEIPHEPISPDGSV